MVCATTRTDQTKLNAAMTETFMILVQNNVAQLTEFKALMFLARVTDQLIAPAMATAYVVYNGSQDRGLKVKVYTLSLVQHRLFSARHTPTILKALGPLKFKGAMVHVIRLSSKFAAMVSLVRANSTNAVILLAATSSLLHAWKVADLELGDLEVDTTPMTTWFRSKSAVKRNASPPNEHSGYSSCLYSGFSLV